MFIQSFLKEFHPGCVLIFTNLKNLLVIYLSISFLYAVMPLGTPFIGRFITLMSDTTSGIKTYVAP
jgi:hypothetical protein